MVHYVPDLSDTPYSITHRAVHCHQTRALANLPDLVKICLCLHDNLRSGKSVNLLNLSLFTVTLHIRMKSPLARKI